MLSILYKKFRKKGIANKALKTGIESYENRHGFRKPKNYENLIPNKFLNKSEVFYQFFYQDIDFSDEYGI